MKHKIKFICRQIVAYVCVIALLVTQNTVLVLSADENGGKINLELGSDYQQKLRPFMTYNGSNVGIASFNYTLNHIENGDNVKFFAKATFSSKEAKEYENVQLSDFYISPEFADKYNLNIPETENNTIVVDHGTILKKQIICIPNNNVHYKGQLSTVDIQGCTFEGVVEGEEIKLAEGLQWRVGYSGGEYYYKVLYKASDGSNIDVTDNIPTNSENYIVTATEPVVKDKPVVSASVKLAAQGDNNKINYVQDKGIVANSSVIVSVSSEDDSDINGMTFTLYSDETKLAGPLAAVKNSDGKYVADFTLELSDKEGCYSREIKDLKYTINGMQKPENLSVSLNGKSSNTVILDKDAPVQASDNPVSLNYDNAQKTVTVKGGFEDNLSGVKKIEYEIEGKKESVVVNDSSFEHTYEYSDLNDSDCDGQYGIELKVTDNAENTLSITDSDGDGGIDITPPKIGEIKLSAVKDNTELELKEVLKNSDSGNYSKETLKLEITAEDDAEFKEIAAISKVMLLDGEAIKYEQQGDMKGYVFYLENDVIGDLKVKLLDVQGNESELYSLKELLAEYEKESDINWNELKTNAWIVDKANPEISVYYHGVVQKNNQYYYNLNGGAFEIRVKEKNGLSKFTVKQEYNGASVDIYPSRIDEDDDGIFTCSVDVNSLSTGWYNYTVKAVDNAGRFDERYYTFYVDKETPSGEIQAFVLEDNVRTDVSVIDNENWMTEKDQNGNNRFITFRMYIESYGSDVESVNFVINGDTRHPVTATLDGSEINGYSDGLFTVLHNKLSVEDTTNRKYIDLVLDTSKWTSEQKATCGNTFNISANVKAISQNTSKEILYDLHIDTEKPEINQIVVSKKNTSLENIVNILSFGAFFNDTILISVKATDGDNDAGISKVTLKHDYLTEEAEMVFDEDSQMYTCDLEIPAGESIFKSNITVKVYDKMGNCTTDFPNDNNVQGSGNVPNNYFVMIEQNPPTATIELPTGDNRNVVYKSNGEVWLNATDQKICVSVNDQGEENSGIREVVVEVDVKDKDGQIIKSEKIKVDKNGNELLTAEVTKDKDEKISEVSYEFSSNDIAAMCGKPGNESYTVKCKVVDNAGNVGYADEKVFYRDVTDPAVTMFEFTPKSENGVESTTELTTEVDSNQLEYGYFFKNPSETGEVKLTATVNDTVNENGNAVLSSGFRKVVFRLVSTENGVEETKQVDNQIDNNKAECIIPANFKGKIYVEVLDMVGNKSEEKTSKAFILDEDKPVIKIEPLPDNKAKLDDMGNKLYTRNADTVDSVENVEFDVTISDKKSGLSEVSYTKSSDLNSLKAVLTETIDYKSTDYTVGTELEHGWIITEMEANLVTEISKTFTFDEDDKNIFLTFNAVDNALIKADTTTTEKFTIDSVSPTVDKFNFKPVTEDNISEAEEFIEELEYGFYFKKQFNAVVTVDDKIPSSGLNKVLFRLVSYDKGEVVAEKVHEINVMNKNAVCTIPAGFKGQIYAQVSDRAENTSQEQTPQAFVVEEVPPVITIEPLPDNESMTDMAGNKLYTGPVKFKVTISDEKAGLRELVHSQASEKNSFKDVVTTISNNAGYKESDIIDNGWQVTKTDRNLITEVSQVFTFTDDDNDIVMSFRATDRSKNTCETMQSEAFTIDTIAPKVSITNAVDPVNDMYYKDSTTFVVTVTERNFDPQLMLPTIRNTYTDAQVPYEFVTSATNSNEHVATFVFYEGDYSFMFTGTDCGGHKTDITTNKDQNVKNDFFAIFNVDATAPVLTTNFKELGNVDDKQIYFNTSKTVTIDVVEHNFLESDMNIVVQSKGSGTGHDPEDGDWYNFGFVSDWVNNGDKHTLQIEFKEDGIYKISISPTDRAGNTSPSIKSAVYEIDTKVPEIYSRNNKMAYEKDFVKTPFSMIYTQTDEKNHTPAPSIEFDDINFDRIEIKADIYRPEYKNGKEFEKVTVDSLSETLSVPVKKKQFTVPNFNKDGVYAITYTAVDKAGNRSEPINDTYFRMVETDVLAYINNSSLKEKTGYYSLMDENGNAISKKAGDFKELSVSVIKLKDDEKSGVLTLREDDKKYLPGDDEATVTPNNISETAVITEIQLPASYFSETFRDDSLDTRMYLSVSKDENVYLDLAEIHIDNESPSAKTPEDFVNWHNYFFTKEVTISLTNITETLNADLCKVYECPRNGERTEIPFEYDKEKKLLTFVLKEGLHNIDITLVDEAGNEWNLDRVKNVRVGNFRLYTGASVSVVAIGSTTGIVLWRRRKRIL